MAGGRKRISDTICGREKHTITILYCNINNNIDMIVTMTMMINNIFTPYTHYSGKIRIKIIIIFILIFIFRINMYFRYLTLTGNIICCHWWAVSEFQIHVKFKMCSYQPYKLLFLSRIILVLYVTSTAVILKVNDLNLAFISSTYIILFDYYQRSFFFHFKVDTRTHICVSVYIFEGH